MPTNPLNDLADIHLPNGVSWWPLAPGWWMLLALIVIIAVVILLWLRKHKRNHYRLLAQHELNGVLAQYQEHKSTATYLQHLSQLLRRTAMMAYPRTFNNSIKGEDWLNWLDMHCNAYQDSFSQGAGRALLIGPYQKTPQADITALHQLSLHWIKHHTNQWQPLKKNSVNTEATNV